MTLRILGDCPRHGAVALAVRVGPHLYCAIDDCDTPLTNVEYKVRQSEFGELAPHRVAQCAVNMRLGRDAPRWGT
jgi:hypothetical protein